MAVNDDHKLKQRGQEPQVGVAHHRPRQHSIPRDDADLAAEVGERIRPKPPRGIGGGYARNSKAREQSAQREREQNDTRPRLPPAKRNGEKSRCHRGRDRRNKRAELDHPVSPGEFFFREQLREQTVFRRAEQRTLRADQKNGYCLHRKISDGEREERKNHHADLKNLCPDRDRALAKAVGEISAGQRKQEVRKSKQRAHKQNEPVARSCREVALHNEINDQELQRIIVERPLKLRDDQTPESQAPVGRRPVR